MFTNIIAVSLILFFIVIIAAGIWAFSRLHKMGLLKLFMQGQWLLGLLTTSFIFLFIVCGVGLMMKAAWAAPVLYYTICFWLVYVWLYNLKTLLKMFALLKDDEAKSISHFMGRSKFFDELIHKSIELSNKGTYETPENPDDPHAVRDGSMDVLLNDEELFKEVFPMAVRKKIKRKMIGLLVHTAIFVVFLILIG
jgi:hypothetical protein